MAEWLEDVEMWMLIPWALVAAGEVYWAVNRRRNRSPFWWENEPLFGSPGKSLLVSLAVGCVLVFAVKSDNRDIRVSIVGALAVFCTCALLTTLVYKLELRRKGLTSPSAQERVRS